MHSLVMSLYVAALFFVLTPGVLLNMPGKNLIAVALLHAAVFALVFCMTHKLVEDLSRTMVNENFVYSLTNTTSLIGKSCSTNSDCPPGSGCWENSDGQYVCK